MARKLYDIKGCEKGYVDAVQGPTVTRLYPDGTSTVVDPITAQSVLRDIETGWRVEISPADCARRVIPNLKWPQFYSGTLPTTAYVVHDGTFTRTTRLDGSVIGAAVDRMQLETDVAAGTRRRLTQAEAEAMVVRPVRYFVDASNKTNKTASYVWRLTGQTFEVSPCHCEKWHPYDGGMFRCAELFREITPTEAAALLTPTPAPTPAPATQTAGERIAQMLYESDGQMFLRQAGELTGFGFIRRSDPQTRHVSFDHRLDKLRSLLRDSVDSELATLTAKVAELERQLSTYRTRTQQARHHAAVAVEELDPERWDTANQL